MDLFKQTKEYALLPRARDTVHEIETLLEQ